MPAAARHPPVVCLAGPTAVGKSELALALCEEVPAEIISVDSALVYRGMDIGTAKPSPAVRSRIPHHLVDIREPWEPYSAALFRSDALRCIQEVLARGHIPLLVGGTMLYFRVLLQGMAALPKAAPAIRRQIEEQAERLGWPVVHRQLAAVDPAAAARIHPNHSQRLQRAMEVYLQTGVPISRLQRENRPGLEQLPCNVLSFALLPPERARHRETIVRRFRGMIEAGLVEEVRQLFSGRLADADLPALRAVGYRQVWEYLQGSCSLSSMEERAVTATCRLARRQRTWLRSWKRLSCFQAEGNMHAAISGILSKLRPEKIGELRSEYS